MTETRLPSWQKWVLRATTIGTLFISMGLTLLVLLTPTRWTSSSMCIFALRPVGQTFLDPGPLPGGSIGGVVVEHRDWFITRSIPLTQTSSSAPFPRATNAAVRRGQMDTPRIKPLAGEGETQGSWLGDDGPSIFVGAMQICSQPGRDDTITCTSASQGAVHSALLPYNLGDALLQLPTAPPGPILLLVQGCAAVLATIVYLYSLVAAPLMGSLRTIKASFGIVRPHPKVYSSRDSTHSVISAMGLVVHPSDSPAESKASRKTGWAILILSMLTLGLAIAANVTELVIVSRAKRRWNEQQAVRVGMTWHLGIVAYLLPCVPVCLLLSMVTAYIPALYSQIARRQSERSPGDSEVEKELAGRSISPPMVLRPEPSLTPDQRSAVSPDQGRLEGKPAQSASLAVPVEAESNSSSWRRSWRGMIGMAV